LWFLDLPAPRLGLARQAGGEFSQGSFNHSVFAKNCRRGLSAEAAGRFFAEVYELSRREGWSSDEHFTVDGTLSESWAGLKSFVRKDGGDARKLQSAKEEDPGNPSVDFRGQQRCNGTHRSRTDPESVLDRKGKGKEARPCFGGHVLMENRNGLCAAFTIYTPPHQVFGICSK